jgi:hypothetical protein
LISSKSATIAEEPDFEHGYTPSFFIAESMGTHPHFRRILLPRLGGQEIQFGAQFIYARMSTLNLTQITTAGHFRYLQNPPLVAAADLPVWSRYCLGEQDIGGGSCG